MASESKGERPNKRQKKNEAAGTVNIGGKAISLAGYLAPATSSKPSAKPAVPQTPETKQPIENELKQSKLSKQPEINGSPPRHSKSGK